MKDHCLSDPLEQNPAVEPCHREIFRPVSMLNELIEESKPTFASKSMTIETQYSGPCCAMEAVRRRLREIFSRLLSAIVEVAADGTHIVVRVDAVNPDSLIHIAIIVSCLDECRMSRVSQTITMAIEPPDSHEKSLQSLIHEEGGQINMVVPSSEFNLTIATLFPASGRQPLS